jgi:hypothetical protein
MTACTEYHRAQLPDGRDCEGQKGIAKEGTTR